MSEIFQKIAKITVGENGPEGNVPLEITLIVINAIIILCAISVLNLQNLPSDDNEAEQQKIIIEKNVLYIRLLGFAFSFIFYPILEENIARLVVVFWTIILPTLVLFWGITNLCYATKYNDEKRVDRHLRKYY